MHLVCLGVMRKFLRIWSGKDKGFNLALTPSVIEKMSNMLLALKEYIPVEFCRKPRRLDELDLIMNNREK